MSTRSRTAYWLAAATEISAPLKFQPRSGGFRLRDDAPECSGQLSRNLMHGPAESGQPVVRQPAGHARYGNRRKRLAAIVVDHRGHAPQPDTCFLIIDGVTLSPDRLKLLEQFAGPH